MYVICGLGNPGKEYYATRHNMGFLTIDVLSSRFSIPVNKLKFKALIGEGMIGTEKVVLVKPQTFMNLSGESLREIVSYYKIPPEKLIVIYDDIDLEVGALRIRPSGSSGTHNGMRSVIYQLQFDNFPRVRIGTGKDANIPLEKYVVETPSLEEQKALAAVIDQAASAVESIVTEDVATAMNKFNVK